MQNEFSDSDTMKERLDKILVEKGYFETKSKAQAAIMAGDVRIDGNIITKSGFLIELHENTSFDIKTAQFVSRGGLKLDKALKEFKIVLKDKICMDAGASTGGFTDCMLQYGAKKVYSIDVGYGQIAWKLRTDKRVKVVERVNIKNCNISDIYNPNEEYPSFVTIDLSFISIKKVLSNIIKLVNADNFEIVSLIKPQFEAGKEQVGKNGIIKDKNIHIEVINNIIKYATTINLYPKNLTFSPIKGAKGNIEYLIYLSPLQQNNNVIDIEQVVETAHTNEL